MLLPVFGEALIIIGFLVQPFVFEIKLFQFNSIMQCTAEPNLFRQPAMIGMKWRWGWGGMVNAKCEVQAPSQSQ